MIFHLIKWVIEYINGEIHSQDQGQPLPQLSPALYNRKPVTTSQYINIATKAMIDDDKKADDIKVMLHNRGLAKDNIEVILNRAEHNYKIWLDKTGGKPALTAFEVYEQSRQKVLTTPVEIITDEGENHALHFITLIGYQRYFLINGRNLLHTVSNQALSNAPVLSNGPTAIRQATFVKVGGNTDYFYLRVVTINGYRDAIFPYLSTETKISFSPRQITEWGNGEPIIEAEVSGTLNKTTQVGFFATDYAVNKQKYQSPHNIDIKLSAFVAELSEVSKSNDNMKLHPKGLWEDSAYRGPSYFSFQGVILGIRETNVDRFSVGYTIAIKFGGNQSRGSDIVIDSYITNSNIGSKKIRKGMHVTGVLWFQGEIAE